MTYVAPSIPAVPAPDPLPAGATDAQRAQWHETMRLLLQREEFLSQHYERWHSQQYRDWYQGHMTAVESATERRHLEWAQLTAAATAAQSARAASEQAVASAARDGAAAMRAVAGTPPPPVIPFPL